MDQPTESPPLSHPTPLKDVLNVVSTSVGNVGSAASTLPNNYLSSTEPSTPPISSPPPSSSSVRSVHNHTSAWEPYIFHYTAGIPTPTLFLFVVNFHEPRYAPVRFLSTQYFPLFRRHFLFRLLYHRYYNYELDRPFLPQYRENQRQLIDALRKEV